MSVKSAFDKYNEAVAALAEAEAAVQASLGELREVAGSSTFEVDGQYYQIRMRSKEGKQLRYICTLDGRPKGRPKKTESEHDSSASSNDASEMTETTETVVTV